MDEEKKPLLDEEKRRCAKVGSRVAQKRVAKNMTHQALATMIGIDGESLRKNETGEVRISAGRVSQVAEILEESVTTFFADVNPSMEKLPTVEEMSDIVAQNFKKIRSRKIQDSVFNIVNDVAKSEDA
jgi:transcriptional regulator with XRE-family HTH domain